MYTILLREPFYAGFDCMAPAVLGGTDLYTRAAALEAAVPGDRKFSIRIGCHYEPFSGDVSACKRAAASEAAVPVDA